MHHLLRQEPPTVIRVSLSKRVFEIVSAMAFLIGIPEEFCERATFKRDAFQKLRDHPSARTMRALCQIRSSLMNNYDGVSYGLYNLRNLDQQHEFFDPDWFVVLARQSIPFIKTNYKVSAYIADVNRYITEHVAGCRELFPTWLEWEYIKELFVMPDGMKETGIKKAVIMYSNNIDRYPFQMYLNWLPAEQGNILLHDGKFVDLLYQSHGKRFTDFNKVQDASTYVKEGIHEFIKSNNGIVMMVDCENSDPYKFCAAIRSIGAYCGDAIQHIRKIILFDDSHSSSAWSVLSQYINIPIEHNLVRRIAYRKSLVDISLAADACKEVYKNGANALILASSDSDFWGLIAALDDVPFYVMVEHEKLGEALKCKLNETRIPYCLMDSFTSGGISDLKEGALMAEVRAALAISVHLNVRSMLSDAYTRTRIAMTPSERQNFETKLYKSLRLAIDNNGDVGITV